MTSTFPQRVAFEDHRFMRAVDLEDEQLYHLQRRWQHNLAMHSWGILCGLEVRINGQKQQQPNVVIHPGMALDGYGRELIVTEVLSILAAEPNLDPAVTYDVWLSYSESVDDTDASIDECTPPGKDCCCTPPDTNLKRIVERPEVLVRRTSERQSGSVTQPREVPVGDLFFSPDRPMKFDAASKWPVFLCKLECSRSQWTVDQTERHYGGLIAERIEMPFQTAKDADPQTRQTALLNGGHPERPDWRFAVLDIPAHNDDEPADNRDALPDDVPAPLSIRAIPQLDGETTETEIRWQAERVIAEADLVMRGGAGIQFETTPAGEFPQAPTSEWGIYRQFRPPASSPAAVVQSQQAAAKSSTASTAKASDKQAKDANTDQFADVLQISMPSRNEGKNSIAIGAVDADGKFSPVLVVNNDQSVDIFGLLRVHGTIYGDTTDLPPLDTATAHAFFLDWLKSQMQAGAQEAKTFVKVIVEYADPGILRDGFSDVEDQREKTLYALLVPQIINLMPDADAGVFAGRIAAAITADGANDAAEKNFYTALAPQIINLMPDTDGGAFAGRIATAITANGTNDAAEKNFYTALAPQIINLMPDADGGAFAGRIATAIAANGTNDAAEKNFYTALAPQIINLMPDADAGVFAGKFAAKIATANDDAEKNFYTALAPQIINLMPPDTAGDTFTTAFVAAISGAAEAKQRTLYTALAKQVVGLMPNNTAGDAFASAFAAAINGAAKARQRNLYIALAKQIVELMPNDHQGSAFAQAFATAISDADDGAERTFYNKLAKPMVELMAATDTDAEAFANKLVGPNVTLLQKEKFCNAMLKSAEKLLSATAVVTTLAADAAKWTDIVDLLWTTPARAVELAQKAPSTEAALQAFAAELVKVPARKQAFLNAINLAPVPTP